MHRKGVPDLIKAAPGVIKEHPLAKFVVVGNDKSVNRLKALCVELKVSPKLRVHGMEITGGSAWLLSAGSSIWDAISD